MLIPDPDLHMYDKIFCGSGILTRFFLDAEKPVLRISVRVIWIYTVLYKIQRNFRKISIIYKILCFTTLLSDKIFF